MNAHFDPSKRLGEYHKQTTPAVWEHQSNPPTRGIGRAWSKSLISARRPWALKGKPRRTPISDTQCLTLNRDRDYELPAVFNFSFSCVKIHISRMSMLTLVFAKEDSRYIWKLQCSDIMRPFWRKVLCFFGLTLHCWWWRHVDISWNYFIQNREDVLQRAIFNTGHYWKNAL